MFTSIRLMAVLTACLSGWPLLPATAAERWAAVEGEASADLPLPTRTKTIAGGKFTCAEQRWSLNLALAPDTAGENGERQADLTIGSSQFNLKAARKDAFISVDIPSDALPSLRSGIRMTISIAGGKVRHEARFSLIGSRRVIEEIAPRCSKRDMSAYRAVIPSAFNPETALARELLETEIKAFKTATKSTPSVAAAMENIGDGRRLLVATICGSSWYYGNSGCNITVHAQRHDAAWSRVYETEGVAMHIDPKTQSQDWPDLVALTFDGHIIVWKWMDNTYLPPAFEEPQDN